MLTTIRAAGYLIVCGLSVSAFAGPEFDEGATDAGSTAATAATVSAASALPITRVRGATSGTALIGAPDRVDMFLLKTGSNPYAFKFDMNMVAGGAPQWNARLCLFKKSVVQCGTATGAPVYVTYARPLATVGRHSQARPFPILLGETQLANATGKLGDYLAPNTEYFVAISAYEDFPQGYREDCYDNGSVIKFFQGVSEFGISKASATDMLGHQTGWEGSGTGGGSYEMPVAGVLPLPASTCAIPVVVNGAPHSLPFDYSFAPAVSLPGVSCAPNWPTNRQFFYAWTPACTGTGVVKNCGLTAVDTAIEVFAIDPCDSDYCTALTTQSIVCNDQCGEGDSSTVNFPVEAGRQYLVWMPRVGSNGGFVGTVNFSCTSSGCSADINGDGTVNAADLSILLGQWGQ
ncbi:MAG: hypothetical protein EXS03_05170 [Phycisphaerales bacterium]|nr:hypothetical protein [Phycisphaerales bacterium]